MNKLFSYFASLVWVFCIVTGALVQFQDSIFPGFVAVTLSTQKILLFLLVVISCISARQSINSNFLKIWLFGGACLLLSHSWVIVFGDLVYKDLITLFFGSYIFYFVIPFATFLDAEFLKSCERYFLILFLPIFILGAFQVEMNDPILNVGGEGLGYEVISWDFYGQVRAFSLFLSGLDYGYFLCCMGAYFVFQMTSNGRSYFGLFGLLFSTLAVFHTSTRLVFILYVMALVSALIISYRKSFALAYIFSLPIVYLFFGYALIIFLPQYASSFGFGDLVKDDSLYERFYYWNKAFSLWESSGFSGFLFGTGQSQGASNPGFIVDSVYLNTLLQNGILGLIGLLVGMGAVWVYLVKALNSSSSVFYLAIVSFYSTFMVASLINTNQFVYMLYVIPVVSIAISRVDEDQYS